MARHHRFTGLSKMAFLLFLMTKLFGRLTLPLLHKMGKLRVALDHMLASRTRPYAWQSNSIICMRVELDYMHASRTQ